jgi:outer membrane protein assembly factor BamA
MFVKQAFEMRILALTLTLSAGTLTLAHADETLSNQPTIERVEESLQDAAKEGVKENSSKKLILLPIVYYTPETKFAAGALVIKNLWKEKEGYTSNVLATASLTINNQILMSLSPRLYFDQGGWDVSGTLFYSYYPNKFYGRGVNNSVRSPESYVENSFITGFGAGRKIYSNFFLRSGVSLDQRKIIEYDAGGLIQNEVQNLAPSLEVRSFNLGLDWDERDYPQAPRQGSWYRVTHFWYSPRDREGGKDLPRFRKVDFDFRQYVWLLPKWVAAGQIFASEAQGDLIPFQYLNSIGGGARMRGYYSGQYRDKAVGLAQTELRYDLKPSWVGSVFAGVARMATRIQDLNSADSYYSGGFGVHYIIDPENRTKLRLDLGFTGKDTGFYFLIGEAF